MSAASERSHTPRLGCEQQGLRQAGRVGGREGGREGEREGGLREENARTRTLVVVLAVREEAEARGDRLADALAHALLVDGNVRCKEHVHWRADVREQGNVSARRAGRVGSTVRSGWRMPSVDEKMAITFESSSIAAAYVRRSSCTQCCEQHAEKGHKNGSGSEIVGVRRRALNHVRSGCRRFRSKC